MVGLNAFIATPFLLLNLWHSMPLRVDIGLQIRNKLWAWLVYACAESRSWDALDEHWLAKIDHGYPTEKLVQAREGRRRVFHQIFRQGNNPDRVRGTNGKYLLEVVSAEPSQAEATSLYESFLWTMLGEHRLSSVQLKTVQNALLEKLNFVQLTDIEVAVAKHLGQEHPALQLDDLNIARRSALHLAKLTSADAIALLCCEYKLAIDDLSLKKADIYLGAIATSISKLEERWCVHEGVVRSLRALIEVRLLRNFPEPITPEMLGIKKRRRGAASEPKSVTERLKKGNYPNKLFLGSCAEAPTVALDSWLAAFFHNYREHHASYVSDLSERLALDEDLQHLAGANLQETIELNKSAFSAPVVRPRFVCEWSGYRDD